jgi:hypothetical protein
MEYNLEKVQTKTLQGLMTLFISMYYYIVTSSVALKFDIIKRGVIMCPFRPGALVWFNLCLYSANIRSWKTTGAPIAPISPQSIAWWLIYFVLIHAIKRATLEGNEICSRVISATLQRDKISLSDLNQRNKSVVYSIPL